MAPALQAKQQEIRQKQIRKQLEESLEKRSSVENLKLNHIILGYLRIHSQTLDLPQAFRPLGKPLSTNSAKAASSDA